MNSWLKRDRREGLEMVTRETSMFIGKLQKTDSIISYIQRI